MTKLLHLRQLARLRRALRRRLCARAADRLPRERLLAERLAVVVPVLDREGWRTRNFLRTLRAQTLPPECLDLTVVDFGSRPEHVAELEGLCAEHRARLVALPPGGAEWNKSHALNVGLRHVPEAARFVLPTDVDMLFAPSFAERVLRAHLVWEAALVLCEFRDLPREALGPETDVVARFDELAAMGEWAGDHAVGPCLSATREWYHRVRGFDERMRRWGFMDLDIVRRAELDGLPLVRVEHRTALLHQWHPRKWDVHRDDPAAQEAMRRQYEANRLIYESDATVVRNPDGWGEAPEGTRVVEPGG
ncbi:MAG: glycosyltransferase family 2 protein [Armatimonadetes bacterium]|nr:glycosyltransferase family 2 protein [Armatimonadota bacterium]